jgi:glycine betaine catabolism B
MIRKIDSLLNDYTMYRVVLYGLLFLVAISIVFGETGILYYKPHQLLFSLLILSVVCFVVNVLFAKITKAPVNTESFLITALILFFIMMPVTNTNDALTLVAAGTIAMASKYVLAINRHHIFNPAAIAPFLLGLFGNGNALWWVGSDVLLPFVAIVGFLIVRKIQRFQLFFAFLLTSIVTLSLFGLKSGIPIQQSALEAFTSWPLIFFATVMLTEPLTMPATRQQRVIYGGIIGILFGSQFQLGPIYTTPEFALIIGNVYSTLVNPKKTLFLRIKEKITAANETYEFVFHPSSLLTFQPGQYLEWTLPMTRTDSRGNRRFFTIASSPTEKEIRLGVRIGKDSSTFKQKLSSLTADDAVAVTNLAGSFTLPEEKDKKLVFIAGGIGITPFRSMVKYLIDKKERRDIVLFYANKTEEEIAYKDIFDAASDAIGLKTVYILSDKEHVPTNWKGKVGRIDKALLEDSVPDYKDRMFYLSGPTAMVRGYKDLLLQLGIPHTQIITDYFPGF